MESSRKMIFGMLILSVFVFIISLTSLYVQVTIDSGDMCGCIIPLPFFIPFVGSTGLFIGMLVFHLLYPRAESRGISPEILLGTLGESESIILKALAENRGELSQSKLTSITGISKVNVFRTLEKMKSRKLIEKRPLGKTNVITLAEGLREIRWKP